MLLDNFTLITEPSRLFITLRDNCITFSKQALDEMGESTYVLTYVQEKEWLATFAVGEDGSELTQMKKRCIFAMFGLSNGSISRREHQTAEKGFAFTAK